MTVNPSPHDVAATAEPVGAQTPASLSDLQKLDDGTYISEIRKNQAGAVVRLRESADRSWKIAALVAAVVLAAGFSDLLRESPAWVQLVGLSAILSWIVVAGLFLRVNHIPEDDPKWEAAAEQVTAEMQEERDAADTQLTERETYVRLQNRIALRFHTQRFRAATRGTVVAMVMTGAASAATIVTSNTDHIETGTLLLTKDGTTAVLTACPALTRETIATAVAELDVKKVGTDQPVEVTFEKTVCAEHAMHLFLDGELILGLADP